MTIVVRVFGQGDQSELKLLAFDKVEHVITLICANPEPWDRAMALVSQNPRIKDDAVPEDPGAHVQYHRMLEVLWRQASDRSISKTDDCMTHRHFYPWLDSDPDGQVIVTLWNQKLLSMKAYRSLCEEIWPVIKL
jgi:hypothetical protein